MKIQSFSGLLAILLTLFAMQGAKAGEAPGFIQETFPEQGVDAAWAEFRAVMADPDGALDARARELIALGISAQVPCDYCVYYHTLAARSAGATDADIREALAVAATVRKWSTMLNGSQYDTEQWRAEVDALFGGNE